ncbi:Peroxisomal membrane protein PMP27 [Dipsacomyces acuminosporus]|nr:Peroxisomal membrane protein PMP27 [Dipsacomyces acuminosporus]
MSGVVDLVSTVANSSVTNVYVKYTTTLVGRDKLCRLAQYFSRFLVYLINRKMQTSGKTAGAVEWLATLVKIQGAMGTTRKIMRSGKFIDFFQLFVRALQAKGEDEISKLLNILHKLGMFGFMAGDTIGLLGSTLGLIRLKDPAKVGRAAQRAWMLAIVSQLLSSVYQLRALALREADLQRVRKHVEKSADVLGDRECVVEEQIIRRQKAQANRQLLVSVLDLTIPLKGLGIVNINEGIVGLAGTITSMLGAQDVLAKITA